MTYYKVLRKDAEGDLMSCHGGTHTWVPGVTYGPVPVIPCVSGFHACRAEDLGLWVESDLVLYEIELDDVIEMADKVVGSTATLGRCFGTPSNAGFVRIAVFAAEQVVHLNPDPRVLDAIDAAKAVMEGTRPSAWATSAAHAANAAIHTAQIRRDDAAFLAAAAAAATARATSAAARADIAARSGRPRDGLRLVSDAGVEASCAIGFATRCNLWADVRAQIGATILSQLHGA